MRYLHKSIFNWNYVIKQQWCY